MTNITRSMTVGLLLLGALLLSRFVLPYVRNVLPVTNLFIPALLIVMLVGDARLARWSAVAGGLLYDVFSPLPFGTYLFGFVIGLTATQWVANTLITNRSISAYFALIEIGVVLVGVGSLLYGQLLGSLLSATITMAWSYAWLQSMLFDVIGALVVAIMAYIGLRLAGRSYATISAHQF